MSKFYIYTSENKEYFVKLNNIENIQFKDIQSDNKKWFSDHELSTKFTEDFICDSAREVELDKNGELKYINLEKKIKEISYQELKAILDSIESQPGEEE